MKKLLLVLAVVSMVIGLASCKKCYECTTSGYGAPVKTEVCDATADEVKMIEVNGTGAGITTKCVKQ